MNDLLAPLSARMRWLGAITGMVAIPALMVLGSLLAGLYVVPLFIAALFAGRWPRAGRGLMWLGAFFASVWIVPYAVGMVLERGPIDLMILGIKLVFVVAALLTLTLDVGLAADAIRRTRAHRKLAI